MEEINIKFSQSIPNDYSMLKIRTVGNEIIEVGVIKYEIINVLQNILV